jgi:cell wall assembly regulator SMI1
MTPFEIAFSAWLLFISGLGLDVEPQLLPPASRADIARLESSIDYALPDDFIALYLRANGQLDPFEGRHNFTDTYVPLFGNYEFITIDRVLSEYQQQLQWYEEELLEVFDVDVRSGDPIAAVAWQPGWVPFAVSNAAYYAVDLSPVRGGSYGQVIEYGHDTDENRVLASSISEFLTLASQRLDPEEANRYDFEAANPDDPHGRKFATLFFNMDWRQQPVDPSDYEFHPNPEMDAWNDANHCAVAAFLTWLEGKGFDENDRKVFETWAFNSIMPMSAWPGLLSPPMPDPMGLNAIYNNPLNELVSLELALRESTNYLVDDLPVTLEEAFTLLHQYRVDTGEWSQNWFNAAARIIQRARPPRVSLSAEASDVNLFMTDVTHQPDGSVLLCLQHSSDEADTKSECIEFRPEDVE